MAEDPLPGQRDTPTARVPRRWRPLERFLFVVAVVAVVFVRYGFDAALTFVVLPLCVLGVANAAADVVRTRAQQGGKAAMRAVADRSAGLLLLGLVSAVALVRISPSDDNAAPPGDPIPCRNADDEILTDCRPTTTTPTPTSTTRSPQYTPTTVADPGDPKDPDCPPPGNQERRLSFTTRPTFCLNRELDYVATVETNYGSFDINLNMDGAPWTVNNFAFLAGWHFYDGVVLAPTDPPHTATSLVVGDPVDPSDSSAAPGYGLAFDPPNVAYPNGPYVVMFDVDHPNRFEIAVMPTRRDEIERSPERYPLLGKVVGGIDIVIQENPSGLGPHIPDDPVVIRSVTIKEVPPAAG